MQKIILGVISTSLLILPACASTDIPKTPTVMPAELTLIIPTPHPTEPACTSLKLEPTPGPEVLSLFPAVGADDYIRGAQDAPVTILVYNDFQCAACNYLALSQQLLKNHPDDVRIIYRYFPYTEQFDKGKLAARTTEAAAKQGKFWEMHDLLFEQQEEWIDLPVESFENWVTARAVDLELDKAQFVAYFNNSEAIERVEEAAQKAKRIGIPQIPFYLINGQIYRGPVNYDALSQVISLIAFGERQFASCPSMSINVNKQYIATLETDKGNIILQLFADKAPLAVNSFVFLAKQGWFNGITFHRVIPGFVAQTGDPSGTGQGNPGYIFEDEIIPTLNFDQPGFVGMANSGPDTNGSQFFITYAARPDLNGKYTIFGKVLMGMDVLAQLTPRNPQPGVSLPPGDILIRVTIEEK